MPRYSVIVTQDRTESTVVEVDAADPAAAFEKALEVVRSTGSLLKWELSDWPVDGPYTGDVDLIEEDPCPVNRRPKSTCPEGCDHGG